MKKTICALTMFGLTLLYFTAIASAKGPPMPVKGQTLYLPLVSHVFLGAKNKRYELTKTFTFRNRDRKKSITLTSIEYFNNEGANLGNLLDSPRVLKPLASFQMPVASPLKKRDKNKGAPCLIIKWKAGEPAIPPLVQCIMIGATGQQGISFSTTATPIP
jgi:hypothetical protein